MPVRRDELETDALKLLPSDRAELAHRLIESLEDPAAADFEAAWIEEAERRYAGYRKGLVTARDAEAVLRDTRLRLE